MGFKMEYDTTDKAQFKAGFFDIFCNKIDEEQNKIFVHVSEDYIEDGQVVITLIVQDRNL